MILPRSARGLILWDVDHTLIETRGLGGELYANAFRTATGVAMVHKAEVTGQTEPSILTATLRLHGIDADEPYLSRYQTALPAEYDRHRGSRCSTWTVTSTSTSAPTATTTSTGRSWSPSPNNAPRPGTG